MKRCAESSWCRCGAEKDGDGRCIATPCGDGLKSHRAFLAPRMPEAKWLRECNPYSGWTLYRLWKPPKPVSVETPANVTHRLLACKPDGYAWKLWHRHSDAARMPTLRREAA
jgi:hypothetical protein